MRKEWESRKVMPWTVLVTEQERAWSAQRCAMMAHRLIISHVLLLPFLVE